MSNSHPAKLAAKARLEADTQPKFFRPRAVPYAMAPKLEEEMDRLQKNWHRRTRPVLGVGVPDRGSCPIRRAGANLQRLQVEKTQPLSPSSH